MAKKPATATLADIVNSPEYKGMNNSVKAQIEAALMESKGKRPLPKTSKTAVSVEEVLDNPAMVKAIKEKIGEDAAELIVGVVLRERQVEEFRAGSVELDVAVSAGVGHDATAVVLATQASSTTRAINTRLVSGTRRSTPDAIRR